MHKNANMTKTLDPPLKKTPHVVVNGKHTDEIQVAIEYDLLKYVCDNFTGTKAKGCQKMNSDETDFIQ